MDNKINNVSTAEHKKKNSIVEVFLSFHLLFNGVGWKTDSGDTEILMDGNKEL
jgi:hypothetical protein